MNKKSGYARRNIGTKAISLVLALFLAVGLIPALALGNGDEQQIEQQPQTLTAEATTVGFEFENAYATVNVGVADQRLIDSSFAVPANANLKFTPVAIEGHTISDVHASSTAYPNNDFPLTQAQDGSYTIPQDLIDSSLVIAIKATPTAVEEPVPGEGAPVVAPAPAAAQDEVAPIGTKSLTVGAWVSKGSENVLTGDSREITYSFSGMGVEGIILAIPYSNYVALTPTTEIQNQGYVAQQTIDAAQAASLKIPAGDYVLIAIPFTSSAGTTSGVFTFGAKCFENGTTAAGLTYYNDGYILEGALASGGIGGGSLAFATGTDVASSQRVALSGDAPSTKLVSTTQETLSIEKTAPASFTALETRSYSEVVAEQGGTPSTHVVTYTLKVASTGNDRNTNPGDFGRINQSAVTVTDTITGFIAGSIASVVVKNGAGTIVATTSTTEGTYSFTLPAASLVKDETYTVAVAYNKLPYTKLQNSQGIANLVTTHNQATLSHIPATTNTAETKVSANVPYAFGFEQAAPSAAMLTVQKQVDVLGNGTFSNYTSGLQTTWGTAGSPVTFELVNTSDASDVKTGSVDANGRVQFAGLKSGASYTLTETQGVRAGFTKIAPVTFSVTLNAFGNTEIKATGSETNYAATNYIAKNVNEYVGTITVDVKRQLPSADPTPAYGSLSGIDVGLYSNDVLVGTTKTTSATGQIVFDKLDINKSYTVKALTDVANYVTPAASSPLIFSASSGLALKQTISYSGDGGSFFLSKKFVDAAGADIAVTAYNATFALYDSLGNQVGSPIVITKATDTSIPVQQMFPGTEAGVTYTLKEIALTGVILGGTDISSQFTLQNGDDLKVTIQNKVFTAKATSSVGAVDSSGAVLNKSVQGQLIIKSYGYDGSPLGIATPYIVKNAIGATVLSGTIAAGAGNVAIFLPAGTYSVATNNLATSYKLTDSIGIANVVVAAGVPATDKVTASAAALAAGAGNVQTVAFMHAVLPNISVDKVSAEAPTTAVDGARFALYKFDDTTSTYKYFNKTVSSASGKVKFDSLEEGTYALVEYSAPSGYLAPDYTSVFYTDGRLNTPITTAQLAAAGVSAPKTVTITASDYGTSAKTVGLADGAKLENTRNASISIRMGSTESSTNSNSTFSLYKAGETTAISTVSPTNSGYLQFPGNIAAGDYEIKQISVNDAYILRTDTIKLTVSATGVITVNDSYKQYRNSYHDADLNGTKVLINFTNMLKVKQEVTKLGETATYTSATDRVTEALAGATFILTYTDGGATKYVALDPNKNMIGAAASEAAASTVVSDANGKFTIGQLDPAFAPYTLKEIAVAGSPYAYELKSYTVNMVLQGSKNTPWTGVDGDFKVKYVYENADNFSLVNPIKMYQIDFSKALMDLEGDDWVPTHQPGETDGVKIRLHYLNSEYKIFAQTGSNGAYETEVGTMVLGTAESGEPNTALSRELAAGSYLIVETNRPYGATGATANVKAAIASGAWNTPNTVYGLYEKSGDAWVLVSPSSATENSKIGMIVTVGTEAATANNNVEPVTFNNEDANIIPTIPAWYSRILVQKNGYELNADGTSSLVGAIPNVVFDVYSAYTPAGGGDPIRIEKLQVSTTGTYDEGVAPAKYGQFLTGTIHVPVLQAAAAASAGQSGYDQIGYIVVERAGSLPSGYEAQAAEYFYPIDVSKFVDGQSRIEVNGEENIADVKPYEIKNFKGTGKIQITKQALTNASSISDIDNASTSTFELYSGSSSTDVNPRPTGITVTTTGSTAKISDSLAAGYYFLKEVAAPAGHYASGTYSYGARIGVFVSGGFIGPIFVEGGKTAAVQVNDRKMASITLSNYWSYPSVSSTNTATYDIRYTGTEAASLPAGFANSSYTGFVVKNSATLTGLPDGVYTFVEKAISHSGFNLNTQASGSNSIVVTVEDDLVTTITAAGSNVGTSGSNTNVVWRNNSSQTSTAATISVNHVAKGTLSIAMGYVNAAGTWTDSVLSGFSTAFSVEKEVGSSWTTVYAALGVATGTTTVTLDEGSYRVKQIDPTTAGYERDTEYVYVTIGASGTVYLQNAANSFAKAPAVGRTLGTESNPLTSANSSAITLRFYNKLNQGQLQVYKIGEGVSGYLTGATFKLYTKEANGTYTDTNASFTPASGVYTTTVAPGTYYVRETVAPSGYVLNAEYHEVVVTANKAAVFSGYAATTNVNSVGIKNAKPTSFTVEKTTTYPDDLTGRIAGVDLTLYKLNASSGYDVYQQGIKTTNFPGNAAHGTYKFTNLPEGTYKVVESLPAELDYLSLSSTYGNLDNTPAIVITHDASGSNNTLTVDASAAGTDWSGSSKLLTIHNEFNGARIIVDKYAWGTNDLITNLSGFAFELYKVDPRDPANAGVQPVATATGDANSNGHIVLAEVATENLTFPATCYVKEVAAPTGYILNDMYDAIVKPVTITKKASEDYTVDYYNYKQTGTTALGVTKTVTPASVSTPLSEAAATASYDIALAAPNNPLPLENYTVSDNSFVFFDNGNAVVSGPSYALKQATIAPAVYKDLQGNNQSVQAVKVNGTWHALSADAANPLVVDLAGATALEVIYSTVQPQGAEAASVGPNFKPGNITLDVDYESYKQDPKVKALTKEVAKISNTATVSATGQTSKTSTASFAIAQTQQSEIKVAKEVLTTGNVYNGGKIDYKITLTNSSATTPLVAPVLIDMMESGKLAYDGSNYTVSGKATNSDTVFEQPAGTGGSVAMWRFPNVTLAPGEAISIVFSANVATIINSTSVNNDLYGTSDAALNYSSTNTTGASFKVAASNAALSSGAQFDQLNGWLSGNKGLFAKAYTVNTPIIQGGLLNTLYSIQTTGAWNSTAVSEKVYPGGTISYQMQVQNTMSVTLDSVVLNQKLPSSTDGRNSTWTQALISQLVLNPASISLVDGSNAHVSHSIVYYNAAGTPITPTAWTLDEVAGFKIAVEGDFVSGSLLTATFMLTVPNVANIGKDLLAANVGSLLYSDFSYTYQVASDPANTQLNAASNAVRTQLVAGASVSGKAFDDINRNNVIDNGEAGIADITVNLYATGTALPIKITTTDANGDYTFADVDLSYTGGPTYRVEFVDTNTGTQFVLPGVAYGSAASTATSSHVVGISTSTVTGDTGSTGTVSFAVDAISNGSAYVSVLNAGISALPTVTYTNGVAAGDLYQPTNMPNPLAVSVRTGESYTITPTEPTREGYTFAGWLCEYTGISGTYKTGTASNTFTMPGNNVTLVAQWTPLDEVRVYFGAVVQNGTTGFSTRYEGNEAAAGNWVNPTSEVVNPQWPITGATTAKTVSGYTFKGWYDALGASALVAGTVGTPLQSSATLGAQARPVANWQTNETYFYAYYEENAQVTVSYKPIVQGVERTEAKWLTSFTESLRPATGSTAGSTANAITGYNFAGWYSGSDITTATLLSTDSNYVPVKNAQGLYETATYYAHYTASTMNLSVTGYTGIYNGAEHGITVSGLVNDPNGTQDTVTYTVSGAASNNQFADVTSTPVTAEVFRDGVSIWTGSATVNITPAPLTVTTTGASKSYDGNPLTNSGIVVNGLIQGEVLEAHTTGTITNVGTTPNTYVFDWAASGSTAKQINYIITSETLGELQIINADYVITASDYVGVYDASSHGINVTVPSDATVSYSTSNSYTDVTSGAVTVNYTVTRPNYNDITGTQTVTITPAPLSITTTGDSKVYDGQALTNAGIDVVGLVAGETASYYSTGSRTVVGTSENTYEIIWDGTAKQANYSISATLGALVVTPADYVITASDYVGVYDGNSHGITVNVPSDATVSYDISNSYADVTSGAVTVNYTVTRPNYNTITGSQTVTITPAPLTVTTSGASKSYDGNPLTNSGIVVNGLVQGEDVVAYTTGTITNVGTTPNTYVIEWTGSANQTNYSISETLGELEVINADYEITASDYVGVYDASGHGINVTVPSDATVSYSTSNSYTNVTGGALAVDYTVTRPNYNDITGTQTVTILPVSLTATTPSASKVYDGAPLAAAGTISGFVAGETASFTTTGSRTEVGTSTNSYSLTFDRSARQGNYTVNESLGNLTITAAPVVVPLTTDEGETPADGEGTPPAVADIADNATPLEDLLDGDVPLALDGPSWALVNLILAVAGVLLAVVLLALYFRKRKETEGEDESDERRARSAEAQARGEEYNEEPVSQKKRLAGRIVAAVLAVAAVILFILTQDMSLPMDLVDWWTIAHAIILIGQIVCCILVSRKKKLNDEDTEEDMNAARQSS